MQIAELEEKLAEEIANRTYIKPIDDFNSEEKVKSFERVHDVCSRTALIQFESKDNIKEDTLKLEAFYDEVMSRTIGDSILERIQDHINSQENEES